MLDFFTVPELNLSMSLRHFRRELKRRGWPQATLNKGAFNFLTVTRPDGLVIPLFSLTPPTTTYAAGYLADDKLASYHVLKSIGAPTPETELLEKDPAKRKAQLSRLLAKHPSLVIKPVDGAHGYDVFTDLTSVEAAEATLPSDDDPLIKRLVQQQLTPQSPEVRAIVIDYHFVAAYARLPARVTGDGQHTISELIQLENSTFRTPPYQSRLAYISEPRAAEYVKKHALANVVPVKGEKVQVVSVCNTGCGGTMEYLPDFPKEKRALAEKIARAFALPVVGVDFLDDYIIELNSSPALYHPTEGASSTFCIEKFVDYLESLPNPEDKH